MRTRRTGKRKKASSLMSKVSGGVISPRSRKMLDHSAANLKKGLASAPIAKPEKRLRLGALKGRMEIKGDIIHSDMEDDWEVQ
jgi:hypothetical protein